MELGYTVRDFNEVCPIDMVDDGYILSRGGEVTVGWELDLPPMGSVGREAYDAMLRSAASAIRGLPLWSVVHRQDIYLTQSYEPSGDASFLGAAYERHFAGRRYATARHLLYLTHSTRASIMRPARATGILGGGLLRSVPDEAALREFVAKAEEFISVWCSGSPMKARRLTTEDILGADGSGGPDSLLGQVRFLGGERSDTVLYRDSVRSGDNRTVAYVLASSDCLPQEAETVVRTGGSAQFEQVAAMSSPLGVMMTSYPHICNLYITRPDPSVLDAELDRRINRQDQFATDGANRTNAAENRQFREDAAVEQLNAVWCHSNVIAWTDSEEGLLPLRGELSSAFSKMGVDAVRDIHSAPLMWYCSMPGAECNLTKESWMMVELRGALSLAQYESFDRGLSNGTFKMTDRLRRVPLTLDVQMAAADAGLITNYNIFLNGRTGTGKSFTTNTMLYGMWSHGEHVFIIDIGGSYEQVCNLVREESGGRDGVYNRWDANHPLSFNPFLLSRGWVKEDGTLAREDPSLNFLVSLLSTLASDKEKGVVVGGFEENIIISFVREFVFSWWASRNVAPVFDDFVSFVRSRLLYGPDEEGPEGSMRPFITAGGVRVDKSEFHGGLFIEALSAYAREGQFGFLLNDPSPADLFTSRFTVFDVGELSAVSNAKFYSVCILCIVNAFDIKMRSKDVDGFKILAIDEAWKAISNETMAPYLRELWKTARKMSTSAMVITQELNDILASDVIKETILQNSDIKMLMNQDTYRNRPEVIAGPIGLSPGDLSRLFSMAGVQDGGRDVFIKWGTSFSAVYTVEACAEQLWAFESNHRKKEPLMQLAEERGSILEAITELAGRGVRP